MPPLGRGGGSRGLEALLSFASNFSPYLWLGPQERVEGVWHWDRQVEHDLRKLDHLGRMLPSFLVPPLLSFPNGNAARLLVCVNQCQRPRAFPSAHKHAYLLLSPARKLVGLWTNRLTRHHTNLPLRLSTALRAVGAYLRAASSFSLALRAFAWRSSERTIRRRLFARTLINFMFPTSKSRGNKRGAGEQKSRVGSGGRCGRFLQICSLRRRSSSLAVSTL